MRDLDQAFRANSAVTSGITSHLPPRGHGLTGRIIVVDDEEFIRDLYRSVFEARGFTVFAAPNGEEAVKLLRTMKFKPDAVIMDHRMRGKERPPSEHQDILYLSSAATPPSDSSLLPAS